MKAQKVDLRAATELASMMRPSWHRFLKLAVVWLMQPLVSIRALASSFLHKRSTAGKAWWRLPRTQRHGVNVIGFVDGEFGLGVMARSLLADLKDAGIPFRIVANEVPSHVFVKGSHHELSIAENFAINIVVTTPDRWPLEALRLSSEIDLRLPTIGYIAWELEGMPSRYSNALKLFDQVWGISSFCATQVCKPLSQKPLCLPIRITAPSPLPSFDLTEFMAADENRYLIGYFFDVASFIERKNPMALVRAFQAAFPQNEAEHLHRQPCLILKTHNTFLATEQNHWQELMQAVQNDTRIHILDVKLSTLQTWSLLKMLDCYVSLHRAEGLGLTVGEALTLNIPTVCTAYGGVTDFSHMPGYEGISFEMISILDGQYAGGNGLMWAEPDTVEAAKKIRMIYDAATKH